MFTALWRLRGEPSCYSVVVVPFLTVLNDMASRTLACVPVCAPDVFGKTSGIY